MITCSSDGFTNFESTNFVEVWWLYLFLCTVNVNNIFVKKNAGFIDSKYVKPSDEHAIRVGWYYVVFTET